MRWTNYFIHPGDNRYYVFTFREEPHAAEYEAMLKAADIPFERHEEGDQFLFGVARTHFRQALRCNHLLHAQHRTKFIPVKGLQGGLQGFQGGPQGFQGGPQGFQGGPQGFRGGPQGFRGGPQRISTNRF